MSNRYDCQFLGWLLLILLAPTAVAEETGLPIAKPADHGFAAAMLDEIDTVVGEGLDQGQMAGAVVLIARQGNTVFRRAYGQRQIEPSEEPMTTDTIFDLASLTKPIATATSVMILADRGEIDIDSPVSKYIPEFAASGKQEVTIAQLLTHTSGLIADNSLNDYADGKKVSFERINQLKLRSEPGEKFVYSDVGFLVLGQLVERVSGKPLDGFAAENVFQPLGMTTTGYRVPEDRRARCATTTKQNGQWLRGSVHDPRAAALDGVAGHAGLFSTADDLARYGQALLNGGELDGKRIMSAGQVDAMLQSRDVPQAIRTWGWDRRSGYSSNRGATMSDSAFGHGGFTGTGIWVDPKHDLVVIFLSNRLHPDGKGSVNRLIGKVGTIAVDAIAER